MTPPRLVPLFTPPLRDLLHQQEALHGSPLSPVEVQAVLGLATCTHVPVGHYRSIADQRGFHDLRHEQSWLWWDWYRTRPVEPRPYTIAEIRTLPDFERDWPMRGTRCTACENVIPTISDLPELAKVEHPGQAAHGLQLAAGVGSRWAKIVLMHQRTGPCTSPAGLPPPCPHCSRPLRTPRAKQCFFCHADWHS